MDPILSAAIGFALGALAVVLFRPREIHVAFHAYLWQEDEDDDEPCEDGEEWKRGRRRED